MKKLCAGLLMGMAAMSVIAKSESLIDDTDSWKMYTRPELSLTDIGGHSATLASLSVGWMLNDKLSLGPSGTATIRDVYDASKGDIQAFDLWYAGLRAEYTVQSWKLVHASASLFVGGGDVSITSGGSRDGKTGLAVVEPGANVSINAWDWVEIGVGISYRFTDSLHAGGYGRKDLEDWNFGVFARFSEF